MGIVVGIEVGERPDLLQQLNLYDGIEGCHCSGHHDPAVRESPAKMVVEFGDVAHGVCPLSCAGINFFFQEVVAKRLGLLHELVPKAVRVAVLVNPGNPTVAETTLRGVQDAAPTLGLELHLFNASRG
jgi:hypothetical protein